MVQFEKLLQGVHDGELADTFKERLEIVQHKLKFMEAVPVAVLNLNREMELFISDYLIAAGAYLVETADLGVYVLYYQQNADLNKLMAEAPLQLENEWQAVQNNRIALLDANAYNLEEAADRVTLVEDLAEILHPGAFIFGSEGNSWVRFNLK